MASQEFYGLEGKLRRTVYAIVYHDMITNITTLKDEDVKYLMTKIKSAINDAVDNSLEFMIEHEIIETQHKKRKKKR